MTTLTTCVLLGWTAYNLAITVANHRQWQRNHAITLSNLQVAKDNVEGAKQNLRNAKMLEALGSEITDIARGESW